MTTECQSDQIEFQGLGKRRVVADFDGGTITSDAGALLLREVDLRSRILAKFADCFEDHRDQRYVEHSLLALLAQRIYGICLGYEDIVDHDQLRHDQLLATLCNQCDVKGTRRRLSRDQGIPLAGKSTLNRLENSSPAQESQYCKIHWDEAAIRRFFVEAFLDSESEPPQRIVLDLDDTDDPLHGHQEGRFFHGYYDCYCYCYLPLYIFCDDHLLCAKLRRSNIDSSNGCLEELQHIVSHIRKRWEQVSILVRGDSGFCREPVMSWCETAGVDYVLGIAQNSRLKARLAKDMAIAERQHLTTGQPVRRFKDFYYKTLNSWTRRRRVIGKAEHSDKGENPRFVVTSLKRDALAAQDLYEGIYCARGDMENRIKEQQLYMFADRTSAHMMRANQLRLWESAVAYVLMSALRRDFLGGTELEAAQCHTIRTKLLKIGAQVHISVRRIWVNLASGYPYQQLFRDVHLKLARGSPG